MNGLIPKVLIVSFSCLSLLSKIPLQAVKPERLSIEIRKVFDQLDTPKPISLVTVPDGSGRSLLVLQGGRVLLISSEFEKGEISTFLEISSELMIDNDFEEGLLGLVFHPKYKQNGLFYLYHSLQNPKRSVLVERRVNNHASLTVDATYSRLVLEIEQPYWNHNSGVPEFGPDGFLYLSTGDGGKANDPHDFAQNTFSL
ncbi:MAG: PQQ-dependent sugar dehydrogenase, partial [Verrucomicrobiota bacterium]|nr:PQQ-dependent sugar dehydrogenase [Verrucomicrobiota bacterium]